MLSSTALHVAEIAIVGANAARVVARMVREAPQRRISLAIVAPDHRAAASHEMTAMSRRYCTPSNDTRAASRYAAALASTTERPIPVQHSTRPPADTSDPSARRAVPECTTPRTPSAP